MPFFSFHILINPNTYYLLSSTAQKERKNEGFTRKEFEDYRYAVSHKKAAFPLIITRFRSFLTIESFNRDSFIFFLRSTRIL
jgi:hypothetical protein